MAVVVHLLVPFHSVSPPSWFERSRVEEELKASDWLSEEFKHRTQV